MKHMKRKWIIYTAGFIALSIYILGYHSARKDRLLVRRVHFGDPTTYSIVPGNFGPGRGGVLASPNEIMFCYIVFTPLRILETQYQNRRASNNALQRTPLRGAAEG